MRVLLKENLIVLIPEEPEEAQALEQWKGSHCDHVMRIRDTKTASVELHDLGEAQEAFREPINVVSDSPDPVARMISNFATAPFELDGQRYRSVESFWQGLKFSDEDDRRRLAGLDGPSARREGEKQGYGPTISYRGEEIAVGTWAHWSLMERACRAKFEQNAEARDALFATRNRPLTHVVRRDSRTIPGVIIADIWMRIRRHMLRQ